MILAHIHVGSPMLRWGGIPARHVETKGRLAKRTWECKLLSLMLVSVSAQAEMFDTIVKKRSLSYL